jgi:DNA-binding NtrC family response regulator
VDEQAMSLLQAYSWPGNVRELENLVERAVVMGAGPQIRAADLPLGGRRPSVAPPSGREEMRESARRRGAAKLQDAVQRAGGNLTAAARLLGIPRSTLLYRMRKRRVP